MKWGKLLFVSFIKIATCLGMCKSTIIIIDICIVLNHVPVVILT